MMAVLPEESAYCGLRSLDPLLLCRLPQLGSPSALPCLSTLLSLASLTTPHLQANQYLPGTSLLPALFLFLIFISRVLYFPRRLISRASGASYARVHTL